MGWILMGRFSVWGSALGDGGRRLRTLTRWTSPRWRLVVLAVGITGLLSVVAAVVDVAGRGVSRPLVVLVGFAVTIAINQIYVVVARRGGVRGGVLEGIDIAEVP